MKRRPRGPARNKNMTESTAPRSTRRTVLCATDLSFRCDRALDRALLIAREWDARLVLLTVVDGADSSPWRGAVGSHPVSGGHRDHRGAIDNSGRVACVVHMVDALHLGVTAHADLVEAEVFAVESSRTHALERGRQPSQLLQCRSRARVFVPVGNDLAVGAPHCDH